MAPRRLTSMSGPRTRRPASEASQNEHLRYALDQAERRVGELVKTTNVQANEIAALRAPRARPLDEWHEDIGCVIWWHLPVCEPPYVGTPDDDNFNHEWLTHWTPLAVPSNAREVPRV